ncbi:MAG: DUF4190 domain-containing protein [Bacteroidales bacterium]|nr:DUF4190 domain-containing protein [Bacteroidales bacterium]
MEENVRNTGNGMGVAALIMGIISLVVAFIPCLGLLAFFTAVVAIVLGAIGISQAGRSDSPRGMQIGGLVTGALALLISVAQMVFFAGFSKNFGNVGKSLEEAFENVGKEIRQEFEGGDFRITIEDGEDRIEIEGTAKKKDLREKLEKLEGVELEKEETTEKQDTTGQEEQ